MNNKLHLTYDRPANNWEEVLPLGNGSLGAMIWGDAQNEKIGLNQDTLWSGYYRDKNNPAAAEYLPVIRELILKGDYEAAEKCVEEHLLGEYGESYLPLGNLLINFSDSEITNYSRTLDIENAIATVTSGTGAKKIKREYFVSFPHQAMFIKLSGWKFDCRITFESQLQHHLTLKESGIEINGQCPEHVDPNYIEMRKESVIQGNKGKLFSGKVVVLDCDGHTQIDRDALVCTQSNEILLMVSFVEPPRNTQQKSYEVIKGEHISDYQKLFQTVEINFGDSPDLPTDLRLANLKKGMEDPALYALYFQYGRYLLIASSRKGSQPANLQGIWSWELRAPWSSNWTTNINLPMNYWLAQTCHLEECLPPYFDWLIAVVDEGKKTATTNYNCRGFVVHHNVDYWKNTNPAGIIYGSKQGQTHSSSWAMWPMAGLWLVQELYKQYQYHLDKVFLYQQVYPVLREACLFILDWLVEVNGTYISLPSTSPENRFKLTEKQSDSYAVTKNSALDLQLIEEVCHEFQETCRVLGIEDELLPEIVKVLQKLSKLQVGSHGQLLEFDHEFIENEPGHRHFSHLYGLFPGEIFDDSPELIEASRISLERRLHNELGHHTTGWSCAWVINFFGILQDSKNAGHYLNKLLTQSTLNNLWGVHPPFQIDANFGGTAGIANLLVNERFGKLNILPALPDYLPEGYVKGLRLKGKRTIDIFWENHELIRYEIHEERE